MQMGRDSKLLGVGWALEHCGECHSNVVDLEHHSSSVGLDGLDRYRVGDGYQVFGNVGWLLNSIGS